VYNAEIAPSQIRGFLLTTWAFFFAFGQTIASVGLQILATSNHPNNYKQVIYSEWAFTGVFLIFLVFLPETPMFFARKGKEEQAKNALRKISGHLADFDENAEYAILEYQVQESLRMKEEQKSSSWTELFKGSDGRRFLITATIPMYGQLVGGGVSCSSVDRQ
jgi:SP family general alpha glucoside:H+ symporter-like MFS transporter